MTAIDRSRRLFFSKISHELRTPVTVLRGEAEVALRNSQTGEAGLRDALQHIVANSDVLQRRLADMMALAHAEDGRLSIARQRVDLVECVRDAAEFARAFAASSGVRLVADIETSRAQIDGDASWLRQALLALIDNAVKHSPENGWVTMRLTRNTNGSFSVEVSDQGPGVPADALPHLFDPYFQTDGGKLLGGSGLGLAVARWVMVQHGGEIAARNFERGGLAVTITISSEPA